MSVSLDKMLTVSNSLGDTPFDSFIIKGEPSNVRWCPLQDEERKTLALISQGSKLFHFVPKTQQHAFIEFDKSFGKLACFEWLEEDFILACF